MIPSPEPSGTLCTTLSETFFFSKPLTGNLLWTLPPVTSGPLAGIVIEPYHESSVGTCPNLSPELWPEPSRNLVCFQQNLQYIRVSCRSSVETAAPGLTWNLLRTQHVTHLKPAQNPASCPDHAWCTTTKKPRAKQGGFKSCLFPRWP